jgi:hypothetical protein
MSSDQKLKKKKKKDRKGEIKRMKPILDKKTNGTRYQRKKLKKKLNEG